MLDNQYKHINGRVMNRAHTLEKWTEANPILLKGEIGFVADNNGNIVNLKVGNSVTPWNDLPYLNFTAPYSKIEKLEEYKYFISYDRDNVDYEYAKTWMDAKFIPMNIPKMGACSSIRCGNFFARNYDWYYDNACTFSIEISGGNGKYSSIGTAGFTPITEEMMVSGNVDPDMFKILPFFTLDGCNECGVFCSMNVSSVGDNGKTIGTIPKIEDRERLCTIMLPRYIIDNFKTAKEAVEYIDNYVRIYATYTDTLKEEYHYIIGDRKETYILEFKNKEGLPTGETEIVITKIDDDFDRPFITNFLVYGTTLTNDNKIDYTTVSKYGMGLERYNIILDHYKNRNPFTKEGMRDLLNDLTYTNMYKPESEISPTWLTELVGDYGYGDLTVQDAYEDPSKYNDVLTDARNAFEHRERGDYKTWQTVSSTIYDIDSRKMYTRVQERDTDFEYELTCITKGYIDALLKEAFIIEHNIEE